ncbi:GDSL LIPASE/ACYLHYDROLASE FAMILY PROTEIN [Salix purpurea]|uniref:GDSL LIPASE/ACYLHYDROLASE FAMILY PROTEIN n=1 Tax=Salix purpurea TaxID=77065 RepID=A0A9Q0VIC6_SALPP|nr:GDSL LIPASE/ACYLHYDROLASE FAMILY PROTEIN [Salix purpurea]
MKLELVALAIWMASILGGECKVVQFIFGDSLSDVGNNMRLSKSLAQASLPWYGIDFGNGLPNGRFTNGRTVADIIGGGILNETGGYFIQRLSLNKQIELFQGTQRMIINKIGEEKSRKFFQESQYVVALGSNDFINNYLMPVYSDSWKYNDQTFIDYLMETLEGQLRKLHGLGARELIVFGLGPMGCIPLQRVLSTTGECQEKTNKLALAFNGASSKLLDKLSNRLANASFKFGDAYDVVNDVISNPYKYGFNNSDSPCCSFGQIRPALTCLPASTLCEDRSKYVFWDEYHPSDSANELIAKELIKKFGFHPCRRHQGSSLGPLTCSLPTRLLLPRRQRDDKFVLLSLLHSIRFCGCLYYYGAKPLLI